MDLSNLTFDELLEAIRSDSGYQSAAARKKAEADKAAEKPEQVEAAPETPATVTEEAPVEEEPAVEVQEETPAEEEPVIEVQEETPAEEKPAVEVQEEVAAEEIVFTPPAVSPSFFEVVEQDEEPFSPVEFDFYTPVSVDSQEDKTEEQLPLALAEEEAEPEQEESAIEYTAASAPEPIELVAADEEDEEEPVKVYVPPVPKSAPEPIDFGGFNIDADIDSLFPEITADEEVPTFGQADDKTRTIEVPVRAETPLDEPVSDKTRPVNLGTVFERPGIVTTSAAYDKTSDLSALPHILPADELIGDSAKSFIRTGEIPKVDSRPKTPVVRHEEEEQMVLPGFFEQEEVVRVDEDVVEEELKRTRSRKVDSFKIEGAEIEDPVIDEEVSQELSQSGAEGKRRRFSLTKTRHRLTEQKVEYKRPSDARTVRDYVAKRKLIALISTIITGVCALVLLITTAIPAVADKINAASAGVNGTPATYVISMVMLCIGIAAAVPTCASGVTCFFTGAGKPNSRTPVVIAALAALIQNIIMLNMGDGDGFPLFAPAAVFLLSCCSLGEILIFTRIMSNFTFLFRQGKEGLHSVRGIDNAVDVSRVSQNVVAGDADIRCSGKLKFATRFMSYSLASDSTDDMCMKLVPIIAGASAVIGIIAGIITKSFVGGFSLFSGALCMGAPVCALVAANLPLLIENKRLHEDGAMISSYAAAFEYESTNAIAVDASELFPGESCNIHGMKTFNGVRVDDAVLTAASMLIAAGGPISSLFENVIMAHNELLLKVEDLKYEERLGLSGWVMGRRVFVGNRKLLENHNVEIPITVDETKYVRGDRQIIYLADAGKIAAFFVVSYGRDKKIADHLRKIENNGINILVRTTDSNINEKFIARCFDLPLNSVKVVSNSAGDVLKRYAEHIVPREDAKLIHNGKAAAFLHAVSSASRLCAAAGRVSTLQTFCSAAGLLLSAMIMIFSGPATLTAVSVCICQLVWLVVGAIVPLFGKE